MWIYSVPLRGGNVDLFGSSEGWEGEDLGKLWLQLWLQLSRGSPDLTWSSREGPAGL